MYGGGDGARALLVSVLENSVNTEPVAERGVHGLLAKKGKITPQSKRKSGTSTPGSYIFGGFVCNSSLTCAKQPKAFVASVTNFI
jgi:hypothetical protein